MSRSIKIGVALVVVIGIGALSFRHNETSRSLASLPTPQVPSVDVSGFRFHPQEKKRYTYRFDRRIAIAGLNQPLPEIHYDGKLFFDVLKVDASGFEAKVSEEITGVNAESPSLLMHVDAEGKNITLSTSGEIKGETQQQKVDILKDLIANWVFPLESDTVGKYSAAFHPLAEESGFARAQKEKLAYLEGSSQTPQITSSSHILEWDETQGLPHSVVGEEKTHMGSGQVSFSSESSYSLKWMGVEPSSAQISDSFKITTALALSARGANASPDAWKGPAALHWLELSQRFAQLSSMNSKQQLGFFGDLVRSLKAYPDELADLLAMLSPSVIQAGSSSALYKVAVGALATAGTAEAQAALVALYSDPNATVSSKGTILSALTTTQAPLTMQTRDFLLAESQSQTNPDLAGGAAFALGAALQNAPSDGTAQRSIASLEQSWTSDASTESQQRVLLDAMGNSGQAQFLPILTQVIDGNEDAALKSKAVFALRFIQTPDAVALLGQELGDSNATIRLAAASAIQVAPVNPVFTAPLQKCAGGDSASAVQSACQAALHRAQGAQGNS